MLIKEFFNKYFFILCPLIIVVVIHIFCTPTYVLLSPECKISNDKCNMQAKIDRKDHLLESVKNTYESTWHMAKTEFRLTIPFVARVLGINTKYGMYFFQFVFGILFFFLLTKLIFQITNDKITTLFFSLGFGFIHAGNSFFSELMGYFDCIAYFLLLVAMFDIPIIFISIALFFAFWTDERAIASSTLVIFWWQFKQFKEKKGNFFLPTKQAFTVGITFIIYLSLRLYLIHHYGFQNQFDGASIVVLRDTIHYYQITLMQMFEGYWIIVVLAFMYLYKSKEWIVGLIFGLLNLALFITSLCVYDNTRSISYAFPSILIALYMIKDRTDLKKISAIAFFFCFILPCYYYVCGSALRLDPIYIRIIKKVIHSKVI